MARNGFAWAMGSRIDPMKQKMLSRGRRRRLEQQNQSHREKNPAASGASLPRTRHLSLTCQTAEPECTHDFFLTNQKCEESAEFHTPFSSLPIRPNRVHPDCTPVSAHFRLFSKDQCPTTVSRLITDGSLDKAIDFNNYGLLAAPLPALGRAESQKSGLHSNSRRNSSKGAHC